MSKLSPLQSRILSYMYYFTSQFGFPPSYSDISKYFGFSSTATVRTYLEYLEKKGYIKRLGRARGIQFLKVPPDLESNSFENFSRFTRLSDFLNESFVHQHDQLRIIPVLQEGFETEGLCKGDKAIVLCGTFNAEAKLVVILEKDVPVLMGKNDLELISKKILKQVYLGEVIGCFRA